MSHLVKIIVTTTIIFLLLAILWLTANAILLIFAGLLFGLVLDGARHEIVKRVNLPPRVALLIVLIGLVGIMVGGGLLLGPRISRQTDEIIEDIPQAEQEFRDLANRYEWSDSLLEQVPSAEELGNIIMGRRSDILGRVTGVFSTVTSVILSLLVIIFIGLATAWHPEPYIKGTLKLFPKGQRREVYEVLDELGAALKQWFLTRLFSMTVIGVLTTIGLYAVGMDFALTLGIITGAFTIIPIVGPILTAIPAVLLGLTKGPDFALKVLVVYILIQWIEEYLVTPIFERKAAKLPPALTIGVQLLLGIMVGFLGVALAAPVTMLGIVLVRNIYVENILHDEVVTALDKQGDGEDDEEQSDES